MLLSKSICIILVLLLVVTLSSAGRSGRRSGHWHSRQPYRQYTKLQNLETQIGACKGKFVCDVASRGGKCKPRCIEGNKVCDGHPDCTNGADEKCACAPPQLCCDNGQAKCKNMEGVEICASVCDGDIECKHALDEPTPNCDCYMDPSFTPNFCMEDDSLGESSIIKTLPDISLNECKLACRMYADCRSVVFNHWDFDCWLGDNYDPQDYVDDGSIIETCKGANHWVYQCLSEPEDPDKII